jgi:hypothetical protein
MLLSEELVLSLTWRYTHKHNNFPFSTVSDIQDL